MARPNARYTITAEDKTKQGLNSVRRSLGSLTAKFAGIATLAGAAFGKVAKDAHHESVDEADLTPAEFGEEVDPHLATSLARRFFRCYGLRIKR